MVRSLCKQASRHVQSLLSRYRLPITPSWYCITSNTSNFHLWSHSHASRPLSMSQSPRFTFCLAPSITPNLMLHHLQPSFVVKLLCQAFHKVQGSPTTCHLQLLPIWCYNTFNLKHSQLSFVVTFLCQQASWHVTRSKVHLLPPSTFISSFPPQFLIFKFNSRCIEMGKA